MTPRSRLLCPALCWAVETGFAESISNELQAPKDENLALSEGSDDVESPSRVGDEAQVAKGEPLDRSIDVGLD